MPQTSDGGVTWASVSYNGVFFMNDLTEDPNSPNKYYSAGFHIGNMGSSYTNDGGFSWFVIDSIPHSTVCFTSNNGWSGGLTFHGEIYNDLLFYNWIQNPLGLKTIDYSNFKLFPNPCLNELTFKVSDETKEKTFVLEMYNSTGQIVYKTTEIIRNDLKISTADLASGVYFIKISNEKQYLGSYPVIKE